MSSVDALICVSMSVHSGATDWCPISNNIYLHVRKTFYVKRFTVKRRRKTVLPFYRKISNPGRTRGAGGDDAGEPLHPQDQGARHQPHRGTRTPGATRWVCADAARLRALGALPHAVVQMAGWPPADGCGLSRVRIAHTRAAVVATAALVPRDERRSPAARR